MIMRAAALPILLAILAACAPSADPAREPTPVEVTEGQMEMLLHDAVNQYRAAHALPPLAFDGVIADEARRHSRDMAEGRVPFGHAGYRERTEIIRLRSFHGELGDAAENVGFTDFTPGTAAAFLEGFVRSPGHRENLEGAYARTGIGVARSGGTYFVTQIFAR